MKFRTSKWVACVALILTVALLAVSCTASQSTNASSTPSSTSSSTSQSTTSSQISQGKDTVRLDLYVTNDMHGNVYDTNSASGLAKTSTFLKKKMAENPNTILLSSGDMWQGSSEANNTKGMIITDWMNELGFSAMTVGNHEFDWGEQYVKQNAEFAAFPFLAINIYDRATNQRVDYCEPSVLIEKEGIKIGVIGAIGDVYNSISASQVQDIYFKTGDELTALVKAESQALRAQGADLIIYSLHDGYEQGTNLNSVPVISGNRISSYYDVSLSRDGHVDVVFEGHTHQRTIYKDVYGVYHLQAGGNNVAWSHVNLDYNKAEDTYVIHTAELVFTSNFLGYTEDNYALSLFEKYKDQIGDVHAVIGYNAAYRNSDELKQLSSKLYLEAGLEKWGKDYDIILGGGYTSCRTPYKLVVGDVCYADIQSLFPFDNNIALCSISGAKLLERFINNTSSDYFITYSDYGTAQKNNIDPNGTYYIITDTFNTDYAPNQLTIIEFLDDNGVYARDLICDFIKAGGYGQKP